MDSDNDNGDTERILRTSRFHLINDVRVWAVGEMARKVPNLTRTNLSRLTLRQRQMPQLLILSPSQRPPPTFSLRTPPCFPCVQTKWPVSLKEELTTGKWCASCRFSTGFVRPNMAFFVTPLRWIVATQPPLHRHSSTASFPSPQQISLALKRSPEENEPESARAKQ